MTIYKFSELPLWAAKVKKLQNAVVKQATNDMLRDIEIAPGITRGGFRRMGTIPRDLGALAGSLQSELHGSTTISGTGENSYVLVAGNMKAGDIARFSWGGNAAPYARAVHDGARGLKGTHWIDVASNKWKGTYVPQAVAKVKAAIG